MERIIRQQEIALAGRCITVRELSVADVRHLVTQTDGDSGLFGELLTLLDRSTGLKPDDLNPFTFSELEKTIRYHPRGEPLFFRPGPENGPDRAGRKNQADIDRFIHRLVFRLIERGACRGLGIMDGPSSSTPSKPVTRPTSNGPD